MTSIHPKATANRRLKLVSGLSFEALALEREEGTGRLLFFPAPLGRMCVHNGFDPEEIVANEERARWLIAGWYVVHLESGGRPDYVAERILHEVAARPFAVQGSRPDR